MIRYVDYFVPEERLRLKAIFDEVDRLGQLPSAFKTKEEATLFFQETVGLEEVRYASHFSEEKMITDLLTRFFEKDLIQPTEVDVLIVIQDELNRSERMANMGHYLLQEQNLMRADVINLGGNHCANAEHALNVAETLLKSPEIKHVLIVGANKLIRNEERVVDTYAVQGDGAGMMYITSEGNEGFQLEGKHAYTNGLLYEAKLDATNAFVLCKNYMSCISDTLKKYAIKANEIDFVSIQNANQLLIKQCLTGAGFKEKQVFQDKISAYGHLDCLDFMINLKAIWESGIKSGQKVLTFGNGWAGSNISLILKYI